MATQSGQAPPPLTDERIKELIEASQDAKSRAYAPYSNFHVGAALLTADGKVFKGAKLLMKCGRGQLFQPLPPFIPHY